MSSPLITLHDGIEIPQLGYGVWQVPDDEAVPGILEALRVGYRHIDTAAAYQNERGVGRAIKESGVPREQIFVTTKLWSADLPDARRAIEESLTKLATDHLDLYLIHWPANSVRGDAYLAAWDAMQEFKAEGLTRSIGVSNFNPEHLDRLRGEVPTVNQVEWHPSFHRQDLQDDMARRGITVEAWSPLGNQQPPGDLALSAVQQIAQDTGMTPAQVILSWHLASGRIVIPKSVTPSRISENFAAGDLQLSQQQLTLLNGLDTGNRLGHDPATAGW